jgi:hypothetical protein
LRTDLAWWYECWVNPRIRRFAGIERLLCQLDGDEASPPVEHERLPGDGTLELGRRQSRVPTLMRRYMPWDFARVRLLEKEARSIKVVMIAERHQMALAVFSGEEQFHYRGV